MKRLAGKTILILLAFLAGMGITAMGLKKPDAFAAGLPVKSLSFGDEESSTEIYFVTDWFCPACRAAEPEILKGARKAMRQAKVVFVDYPIHPETFNYIPYNLSFIVREKAKYLEIREALAALARKTKEPTPEDVQAAVSTLGVKYVPLNYADVVAGMQYFSTLTKKFKVPGTPSVVVLDSRTGKTKTLYGSSGITSDNILKALAEGLGKVNSVGGGGRTIMSLRTRDFDTARPKRGQSVDNMKSGGARISLSPPFVSNRGDRVATG